MLCPPEDSGAVADAILKLVRNPELFLKMSENASNHVREFSPFEKTIKREAELIFPDKRLMIL
jgi:glycosyltransferase involved in cell wall biosynthesis